MTTVQIAKADGGRSDIDEAAFAELQGAFRGRLITPADDGYDGARKVWNGLIDRRPGLIAQCSGVADVIAAVNFASTNGLLVAVRGGGHSWPGHSMCDDGLVIDLSSMRGVRVDLASKTVRAQGGALWGDVDHETQAFGLATPGGIVSETGIAGLTLGGGSQAWLIRKYGSAADNLVSADMVTANGSYVTASATENEDLFWAIRGGGGNFGVVTSFEYQLHPVGPLLLAGFAFFLWDRAKEVTQFYVDYVKDLPDELTTALIYWNAPPAPFLVRAGPPRTVERLEPAGPVLGLVPTAALEQGVEVRRLTLRPGDVLVLHSDGLEEVKNEKGENFGADRIAANLRTNAHLEANMILGAVIVEAEQFSLGTVREEDITAICAQFL